MKDGMRLCNAEKDLPKVNSPVVFFYAFWVYVIIFSGFEKITLRYQSKFSCCLFKENPYAWYFSSYARPLKIYEVCNFGVIAGSLCEHFVEKNWSLVSFNLELFMLQDVASLLFAVV